MVIRGSGIALLLVLVVASCGDGSSGTPSATASATANPPAPVLHFPVTKSTHLRFHPPSECRYPGDDAVDRLRADSDLVARVDVGSVQPTTRAGVPGTYYEAEVSSTVESRVKDVPTRLTIGIGGGPVMQAGSSYIAFLYTEGPAQSTWTATHGLSGLFLLQDERLYLYCANYDDPSTPLVASGERQGEHANEFVARLRSRPQPRRGGSTSP